MGRGHSLARQLFSQHPPSRFGFNPNTRLFQVDEHIVAPADFAAFRSGPREPITEDAAGELITNSDLLLGVMRKLYMMPRLNVRLKEIDDAQAGAAKDGATEAMIDVYADLTGENRKELQQGKYHTDFRVSFLRPGHPDFNVLGNCACMGITQYGWAFRERTWAEGFGEFDFHVPNVDRPEQEVALLAGAGALAYLVDPNTEK